MVLDIRDRRMGCAIICAARLRHNIFVPLSREKCLDDWQMGELTARFPKSDPVPEERWKKACEAVREKNGMNNSKILLTLVAAFADEILGPEETAFTVAAKSAKSKLMV